MRNILLVAATGAMLFLGQPAQAKLFSSVGAMAPISDHDERKVTIEEVSQTISASHLVSADSPVEYEAPTHKKSKRVNYVEADMSSFDWKASYDLWKASYDEADPSSRESLSRESLSREEERDIYCLTEAIYFESLHEPEAGQIAVANVIMNRANWNKKDRAPLDRHRIEFSGGICGVVDFKISKKYMKPIKYAEMRLVRSGHHVKTKHIKVKYVKGTRTTCAFSYRCERGFQKKLVKARDRKVWQKIKTLATNTYIEYNSGDGVDPSGGATFYHADYVSPWWRKAYERTTKIGRHIFYKID